MDRSILVVVYDRLLSIWFFVSKDILIPSWQSGGPVGTEEAPNYTDQRYLIYNQIDNLPG